MALDASPLAALKDLSLAALRRDSLAALRARGD
jgi:hypothetical protein